MVSHSVTPLLRIASVHVTGGTGGNGSMSANASVGLSDRVLLCSECYCSSCAPPRPISSSTSSTRARVPSSPAPRVVTRSKMAPPESVTFTQRTRLTLRRGLFSIPATCGFCVRLLHCAKFPRTHSPGVYRAVYRAASTYVASTSSLLLDGAAAVIHGAATVRRT